MMDIIITRPKNECRSLAKMLIDHSAQVYYIPILKFKYSKLIVTGKYDYYIVTSKKAIKFIKIQELKDAIFLVNGKGLYNYTVKQFPNNKVINTGDYAQDIYNYIKHNIPKGNFAYLRGGDISFNFKNELSALRIELEEFISYESIISIANILKILKLTSKGKLILTFFSNKAVNGFIDKANKQDALKQLSKHIALCLSNKIASQIPKNLFYKCIFSAPNMDEFIKMLNNTL